MLSYPRFKASLTRTLWPTVVCDAAEHPCPTRPVTHSRGLWPNALESREQWRFAARFDEWCSKAPMHSGVRRCSRAVSRELVASNRVAPKARRPSGCRRHGQEQDSQSPRGAALPMRSAFECWTCFNSSHRPVFVAPMCGDAGRRLPESRWYAKQALPGWPTPCDDLRPP